ncbi:MAG: hypothetical protein WB646_10025 [Steroidobacteraceae bacterium]
MSTSHRQSEPGTMEECVDQLDGLMEQLERYPAPLLAFALRAHLASLLRALVEGQVWSREQVRQFVVELEQEALGVG